jgi:hypothetical protein
MFLKGSLSWPGAPEAFGFLTRQGLGGNRYRTLCISSWGAAYELVGADNRTKLLLGPRLPLQAECMAPGCEIAGAAYDAFSNSNYYTSGNVLYRLDANNRCTAIAGDWEATVDHRDGPGSQACFHTPSGVCCTGRGDLYVQDTTRIRKVQLPDRWRASSQPEGACDPAVEATVTTFAELPFGAHACIRGLEYLPDSDSLVFCTETALYRLPLSRPSAEDGSAVRVELLAGAEGNQGAADGIGGAARFAFITGLTVDGAGCMYVTELVGAETRVRKVYPDGTVSTVTATLHGASFSPAILPNGYLAMFCGEELAFIDLGLTPRRIDAQPVAPEPLNPPPCSLAADLAALLDTRPHSRADVTVVVGGRSFPAHRAILAARCDYFRKRLEGDFEDSRADTLNLPDAEPDVFAPLLRFIYTGAADIPPDKVQAVAELADRLLLVDLRRQAEDQLLAEVTPETVADVMLWAAAHERPSFSQLLARLKHWYLDHSEEVLERAPESLKGLMMQQPLLVVELMRSAQRRRPWRAKRIRSE